MPTLKRYAPRNNTDSMLFVRMTANPNKEGQSVTGVVVKSCLAVVVVVEIVEVVGMIVVCTVVSVKLSVVVVAAKPGESRISAEIEVDGVGGDFVDFGGSSQHAPLELLLHRSPPLLTLHPSTGSISAELYGTPTETARA